ncbi:MAG: hypothetical protein K8R46_01955 [Pirellulales bacterium]|nr:hypothetical protein [Pirellulales bacterium]
MDQEITNGPKSDESFDNKTAGYVFSVLVVFAAIGVGILAWCASHGGFGGGFTPAVGPDLHRVALALIGVLALGVAWLISAVLTVAGIVRAIRTRRRPPWWARAALVYMLIGLTAGLIVASQCKW